MGQLDSNVQRPTEAHDAQRAAVAAPAHQPLHDVVRDVAAQAAFGKKQSLCKRFFTMGQGAGSRVETRRFRTLMGQLDLTTCTAPHHGHVGRRARQHHGPRFLVLTFTPPSSPSSCPSPPPRSEALRRRHRHRRLNERHQRPRLARPRRPLNHRQGVAVQVEFEKAHFENQIFSLHRPRVGNQALASYGSSEFTTRTQPHQGPAQRFLHRRLLRRVQLPDVGVCQHGFQPPRNGAFTAPRCSAAGCI
jgi:hypothetical protein